MATNLKTFTAVYNVMSKCKRNASSSTHYKSLPKYVKTMGEAHAWWGDYSNKTIQTHRRLVEIRENH
jgi:hypothetical protein